MPSGPGRSRTPVFLAITAIALLAGAVAAAWMAWISDDAYISFRYAQNLIEGRGLVFNAGERVEGYSNFLWTLLTALGMRVGVEPEAWSTLLGILAYLGAISLLAWLTWRRASPDRMAVPIAAVGLATTPDAWAFATSGLETSWFTFLAVAAFAVLAADRPRPVRAATAGALLALLVLTRPDGVLFAVVGLAYLATAGRPRARSALACAGVLTLVLAPYALWKLSYYGELLPNTYFAKSASRAWWSQGLAYVGLFFRRYPVLALAAPLGVLAIVRPEASDGEPRGRRRQAALAAGFALAQLVYVARVGGDFMFARFLIPSLPFLLILIELGVEAFAPRAALRAAVTAALAATLALSPSPIPAGGSVRGIVDERAYYLGPERETTRRMGERLRRFGAGLPLRLSFGGAQAIVAYRSAAPVAIESATGLTDRWIARQPVGERGRIGHEKAAPWRYLIETRRAHLVPGRSRALEDTLSAYVPPLTIWLDDEPFTLLTWDPAVMDSLARRGARVPHFLAGLDGFLREIDALPDSVVRAEYERLERFYFAGVNDPARERPLRRRLGLP